MMYLEISAEESGKSTRLAKDIVEKLENEDITKAYVFSFNKNNFTEKVLPHIPKRYHRKVKYGTFSTMSTERDINEEWVGKYFDEFDHIRDGRVRKIFEDGYYCTTPRIKRPMGRVRSGDYEDFLIKLIKLNKEEYTTHYSQKSEEEVQTIQQSIPSDDFDLKYKCWFWE